MESKRNAIVELHQAGNCASKIIKGLKLPRSTVYNVLKRYKETGHASDRSKTARTPQLIKSVREKITRNSEKHQSACKRGTCGSSYHAPNCRKDLGEYSYKKVERQLLSEATRLKRLQRGKHLSAGTRCPIIWTDEKTFTVQRAHNRQNNRILAKSIKDIPPNIRVVGKRQKPESCIMWAGVTCDGQKTPLFFFEVTLDHKRVWKTGLTPLQYRSKPGQKEFQELLG